MTFPFGGIGVGPFGLFALGREYETPLATARGQLASSRSIGADGQPQQVDDGTGALVGMPDTAQRVMLLLAQVRPPKKINAFFNGEVEAEVRRVLRPVTNGANAAARVLSVDFATERDITTTRVRYLDLLDGRVRIANADGTVSEA
jgi:hypothetical protein